MIPTILSLLIFVTIIVLIIYSIKATRHRSNISPKNFVHQIVDVNKYYRKGLEVNKEYNISFHKNYFYVYHAYDYSEPNTPLGKFKNSYLKHYRVTRTTGELIKIRDKKVVEFKIPNPPIVDLNLKLKRNLQTAINNKDLKKEDPQKYFSQLYNSSKKIKEFNVIYDQYFHLKIPLNELTIMAKKLELNVRDIYEEFINYTVITNIQHESVKKRLNQ